VRRPSADAKLCPLAQRFFGQAPLGTQWLRMLGRTVQYALGVIAAGWVPDLVQAPSGRAAWDLRTTGRQVVVQGHQAHPSRLPSSFHMASVEDTAEECRETGAVSFHSTNLALVSNRDSHCRAESGTQHGTCALVEYVYCPLPALPVQPPQQPASCMY
jgi:hypothetical protein